MFEILTSLVNWYLTHLGQVLTGILGLLLLVQIANKLLRW